LTASTASAAIWQVNALVEATPISGPARVGSRISASRAIVEVATFTIAAGRWPPAFAALRLASVSAVSPDWEMVTNSVSFGTTGLR